MRLLGQLSRWRKRRIHNGSGIIYFIIFPMVSGLIWQRPFYPSMHRVVHKIHIFSIGKSSLPVHWRLHLLHSSFYLFKITRGWSQKLHELLIKAVGMFSHISWVVGASVIIHLVYVADRCLTSSQQYKDVYYKFQYLALALRFEKL